MNCLIFSVCVILKENSKQYFIKGIDLYKPVLTSIYDPKHLSFFREKVSADFTYHKNFNQHLFYDASCSCDEAEKLFKQKCNLLLYCSKLD